MDGDGQNTETVSVAITGGALEVLKSSIEEAAQRQDVAPVTLDEAKLYLRVDSDADDAIVTACLAKANALCQAVSRLDDEAFSDEGNAASVKPAVLYTLGYLYQNREGADHLDLLRTLRALLMDIREEVF